MAQADVAGTRKPPLGPQVPHSAFEREGTNATLDLVSFALVDDKKLKAALDLRFEGRKKPLERLHAADRADNQGREFCHDFTSS
jgi:hypothetical protein